MSQPGRMRVALHLCVSALFGAAVGAFATYYFVPSLDSSLEISSEWVAAVDGKPISTTAYRQKIEQLGAVKNIQFTPQEVQTRALDDLVDTHLLLRAASKKGLFHSDAGLEQSLRNAMMVELSKGAGEPSQAELQQYYADQGSQFREPARVHIQRMVFRGPEALKAAEKAHALLVDGADFAVVKAQYASPDLLALPSELISSIKLVDLLGEEVSAAVVHLPRGAITEPLQEQGGYAILHVRDNEPARKRPLNSVRSQVLEHYLQHQREQGLASVLLDLREAATLKFNNEILQSDSGD